MKKKLIGVLIFIILVFSICWINGRSFYGNSYIGNYQASNNTTLNIGRHDKCTLVDKPYKDAFYIHGRYYIKGNSISIKFDKNDESNYGVHDLKGWFQLKGIKLYDSVSRKYYVYLKE